MTSQGGVFITQEQIYDEVLGLKEGFGEVKALLEQHIALETQRNESIEVRLENHGTRLGDLGTQHANLESRVTKDEADIAGLRKDITAIQEADTKKESRRATWPQTVGAIVAIVTGTAAIVGLIITFSKLAELIAQIP